MKKLLTIVALGIIYPFAVLTSSACSLTGCLNNGMELRQDFEVVITHDGHPLAGVTVVITNFEAGDRAPLFSGLTSPEGTIQVVGLPADNYWLRADLLGISAFNGCFHIGARPSRKAKRKVAYPWAEYAPATQKVAGEILDSQPGKGGTPIWNISHRTEVPIRGASLKLQNPLTGEVYYTLSDSSGDFAFDPIPIGVYVLHIEGGVADDRTYESTDLPIKVNPNAKRDTLHLKTREAGGGSCGGMSLELQTSIRRILPRL